MNAIAIILPPSTRGVCLTATFPILGGVHCLQILEDWQNLTKLRFRLPIPIGLPYYIGRPTNTKVRKTLGKQVPPNRRRSLECLLNIYSALLFYLRTCFLPRALMMACVSAQVFGTTCRSKQMGHVMSDALTQASVCPHRRTPGNPYSITSVKCKISKVKNFLQMLLPP